ncbi:MAG: TIGR01177 family methyltransferase [Methanosarcinales archaeon]|nr:MAG: TIGR01177 family methyltransferase [Methanosarcinales archaeon]
MKVAFELSGEHETLPKAEVLGCLEAFDTCFKEVADLDMLFIIEIEEMPSIASRLAMTHNILEVLGFCPADTDSIADLVGTVDLNLKKDETFCVRARQVKEHVLNISDLEKQAGAIIYKRGYRVDLKNPDVVFRLVLTQGKCAFGKLMYSVDRTQYESRRPHRRLFFHPGALLPRVARALVNISSICEGGTLLDPFCGTGGILIEAGLTGARCIGADVQRKMVLGANTNLRHYGIGGELMIGDARNLGLADNSVDAVVTDPPYGRSALFRARSLEDLYDCSLKEIHRILRPGNKAVVVSQIPIEKIAEDAGFTTIGHHRQRVHKSLTRRIIRLEKMR